MQILVVVEMKCSCANIGGNANDPNCPVHGQNATNEFRRTHPWYTPQVEAAHKILCDAADHLDTTERRLAHGELAQAVSNLSALRIEINNAFDLLTGALKSDAEIVLGVFRSEQPQQIDPPSA